MQKYLIITAVALVIPLMADAIGLTDGQMISGRKAEYRNGNVVLDGNTYNRNDVAAIYIDAVERGHTGEQAPTAKLDLAADSEFLLESAITAAERFPDASGIILIDHGTYLLEADGKRTYSYHFAGIVLDQSTLDWGQLSLWFEDGRSRAKIDFASTISLDGEQIWWDTTDYVISEPSEGGVFFDYGKVLSAVFPGAGVGSIVEFRYETETYNPFDENFFSPGFYFQSDVPTLESRCTVVIPSGKQLNFKNYNWPKNNDSPAITEDERNITYEWIITDSPPFVEEPHAPSYGDLVPRFDASLFPDWEYIYDWLGGLMSARMVATEEIKAKVAEITSGAVDMADSIDRLYIWVQREIHYISIKGSVASGQTGHSAEFTFEKKYGDCTDKSILLSTMLREIGVEAYPIIIMTNDEEEITREIPDLGGNHAITLIYLDGEKIFLDPTSTTHRFPYFRSDDVGVTYVCPLCREWGMTSVPSPKENARYTEIRAVIDGEGRMSADYRATFVGSYKADYRGFWESQPEEYRATVFQNWMSYVIPGAEITEWSLPGANDLLESFSEEAIIEVPSYPARAGDLWILKIPEIDKSLTFDEVSIPKRRFPIEYTAPYREVYLVKFTLPDDMTIEYLPEGIDISNEYAAFKGDYSQTSEGFVFEAQYDLKKRVVPVSDYYEYRKFCMDIARFIQKQTFIRRK